MSTEFVITLATVIASGVAAMAYFHFHFSRLEGRLESRTDRMEDRWIAESKDFHGRLCKLEEKFLHYLGVETKER